MPGSTDPRAPSRWSRTWTQKKQGDELFGQWRGAEKSARPPIYEKILATCYATKWYEAVRLWTQ